MPVAHDIAEYLEDQTIGTVGTDIFVGIMPNTPDDCIVIWPYAGQPPDIIWDGEYPSINVKVRNTAQDTGWTKIYSIMKALHKLTNTTIESTLYHRIEAMGSPAYLERDQNNRYIFNINFSIIKEVE